MKKTIFLIISILGINLLSILGVKASTYAFYEDNYIDGIYITKQQGAVKYYQKARFIRQSGTNKFSYCVQPFTLFNETGYYDDGGEGYALLSNEQIQRIRLIAYFGYNYPNHYEDKWYAITQFMIWQTVEDPNSIYFTDGLNGNRIERFGGEINEINSLINNYLTMPSFANGEINIVEDNDTTIIDSNNVLANYHTSDDGVTISNNTLTINNPKEGSKTIEFERNSNNYNYIPLFYRSSTSQDLMTIGDVFPIKFSLKVNTEKTEVNITKIDSDTKDITPSGEASLSGAEYMIYDQNMDEIGSIEIGDDSTGNIYNLNYGKYYIKEIASGIGYTLDDETYEFEISHDNTIINLSLENKVIEKEIEIHKQYGDDNLFMNEANIEFEIYDYSDNLITTVITNQDGIAKLTIPYGRYKLVQKNSTSGYLKTDDIIINVEDDLKETIDLYDYKIKVPNTKKDKSYLLYVFVLLGLYYVKKRIFN